MGCRWSNIEDMLTKKRILFVAIVGMVLCVVFIFSREFKICPAYSYSSCAGLLDSFANLILISFPLFLFSLITYKLPERVYRTWSRFALWWIPLSMLLILVVPSYDGSLVPVDKGRTALATSLFFLIISLTIVTVRLIKNPAKKQ